MYRLANESSDIPARGPGVLTITDAPLPEEEPAASTGTRNIAQDNVKSIDTESERRCLLRKLQTSSMKKCYLQPSVSSEDEEVDSKSTHATTVRVWWHRARQNIDKASRKSKKQLRQLGHFRWKKKQAKHEEYDEMKQTPLEAFFEMDSKSTASDPRGGTDKSRVFNLSNCDHGDNETKSVSSRQSLPAFLRPVFAKKKHRGRKMGRIDSFTDKPVGEFSVEVQPANRKSRPSLTRQGSSFVRRLLGAKDETAPSGRGAFLAPASSIFPARLTPTTTDTTTSDNEEDEYLNTAEYESQTDEVFEEEPLDDDYDSEDDEDITQFFRPIKLPEDESAGPLPDRWSPSPSPSNEAELAPRLPVRRPMPDEEVDAPLKLVTSHPPKQIVSRKDSNVLFPAPSPVRAKPKKSWSGESSILSLLGGFVCSWSEGSKGDVNVDDPSPRSPEGLPKNGILKRSSLFRPARPRKSHRSVSFDSIFVREYDRVLGDNPACAKGPPISIGWQYESKDSLPLEVYEQTKPSGRTKRQLHLSASRRKTMLLRDWNFHEKELDQAQREIEYIQYLRSKTVYSATKRAARKPTADDSDTSQPSLRRETAERAARYSPTPETMRMHSKASQP